MLQKPDTKTNPRNTENQNHIKKDFHKNHFKINQY